MACEYRSCILLTKAKSFRPLERRWLRMLFTREFSLPDAMIIWDGLFSTEQPFELVPWVCVAMLIRIRNNREFQVFFILVEESTDFHSNTL